MPGSLPSEAVLRRPVELALGVATDFSVDLSHRLWPHSHHLLGVHLVLVPLMMLLLLLSIMCCHLEVRVGYVREELIKDIRGGLHVGLGHDSLWLGGPGAHRRHAIAMVEHVTASLGRNLIC